MDRDLPTSYDRDLLPSDDDRAEYAREESEYRRARAAFGGLRCEHCFRLYHGPNCNGA